MNKSREVPIIIIVKKRGHGSAHHGGAWKVALADFMTAMFALFLVLWLVNQSSDVKSAIAGYFQDPLGRADEFGSSIMPGEGAQASTVRPLSQPDVLNFRRDRLMQMAERLKEKLDKIPQLESVKDHIEITLTDDGLQIELLEDSTGVFFETGLSTPSPRGRQLLTMLGHELGSLTNAVRVDGYTDARPFVGNRTYTNWELSADRANAARRILTESGLPPSQVVQIRGFADRSLRDPEHPESARNRRVSITMLLGDEPVAGAPAAAPELDTLATPEAESDSATVARLSKT